MDMKELTDSALKSLLGEEETISMELALDIPLSWHSALMALSKILNVDIKDTMKMIVLQSIQQHMHKELNINPNTQPTAPVDELNTALKSIEQLSEKLQGIQSLLGNLEQK
jgi:hypothetical protein